ncbi:MAG: VOC family protein [Sulfitobacter sp.]
MSFTPYIHFQGNCAQAMRFYADVFGASDLWFQKYSDAPEDVGVPKSSDRIMHAHFSVDGQSLMGADFPDGFEGDPQKAVSISFAVKTLEEGHMIFDRLAEGGDILMPFSKTFWSPGYGMLKDQFGTHWMISIPG